MKLTLQLPGLLTQTANAKGAAHPLAALHLPALTRLLAKAERTPATPLSPLPGAARLGALALGWPEGHWLRADPVLLSADHRGIYLLGRECLGLTVQSAPPLIAELNRFLQQDGLTLYSATPHQWYLHSERPIALTSTPLLEVIGKDIGRFQPGGADARRWQLLATELSMLLASSAANQAQAKPVSALWLWGEAGAALPSGPTPALSATKLYSDDAAWRGYAHVAGVASGPMPEHFDALSADETIIVHSDTLAWQQAHGDVEGWLAEATQLEQAWLAPALGALQGGALECLAIEPGNGQCYEIRRANLWRFWRRHHALVTYL